MRTLAERLAGKAAVVQVNTQECPALATRFGVRGIPVIMMLRNGRSVAELAGAQTVEAVLAWFQRQQ